MPNAVHFLRPRLFFILDFVSETACNHGRPHRIPAAPPHTCGPTAFPASMDEQMGLMSTQDELEIKGTKHTHNLISMAREPQKGTTTTLTIVSDKTSWG